MSLEDLLRNRQFLMRMIWIGFFTSLVFIGIGMYIIVMNILG